MKNNKQIVIPRNIADSEIIVRGIFTPMHYSKSKHKLKREAFLPPRGRNEISTYRLLYTNSDFCKNHASNILITSSNYIGLSIILAQSICSIPQSLENNLLPNHELATLSIIHTPLDKSKKIRTDSPIYITDEGNPAHADLLYNFTPTEGKPIPAAIKKIANKLSKQPPSKFFKDPFPKIVDWQGEILKL